MYGIQSSLYTVAIALCVFSTGILGGKTRGTGRTLTFFTAYLIIESLCFLFELLMIHPATPLKSLWLGLLMATSYLSAPCLWLTVREIAEGAGVRLSSLGRGHVLVVLLGAVLTLPLIQNAHLGFTYPNTEHPISDANALFIHATMLLCIVVYCLQVPYYLKRCLAILGRHVDHTEALFSSTEDTSIRSLRFLILIICTTWLLSMLRTLDCMIIGSNPILELSYALADVSVTIGSLYAIAWQATSFGEDEQKLVATLFPEEPDPSSPADEKYARSSLDEPTRRRIRRKLEEAMAAEQLYCDSGLSLRSLCRRIHENVHYVSQVINQDLGANFYEFVNTHRIEHAKRALVDEPGRTVLDIALAVGFNSKSTFNTAFRRYAGTTPTRYRTAHTDAD